MARRGGCRGRRRRRGPAARTLEADRALAVQGGDGSPVGGAGIVVGLSHRGRPLTENGVVHEGLHLVLHDRHGVIAIGPAGHHGARGGQPRGLHGTGNGLGVRHPGIENPPQFLTERRARVGGGPHRRCQPLGGRTVPPDEPRCPLTARPTPGVGQPDGLGAHRLRPLAGAVRSVAQRGGIGGQRAQVQALLGRVGVAQSVAAQSAGIDAGLQFIERGLPVMQSCRRVRGACGHRILAPAVSSDSV